MQKIAIPYRLGTNDKECQGKLCIFGITQYISQIFLMQNSLDQWMQTSHIWRTDWILRWEDWCKLEVNKWRSELCIQFFFRNMKGADYLMPFVHSPQQPSKTRAHCFERRTWSFSKGCVIGHGPRGSNCESVGREVWACLVSKGVLFSLCSAPSTEVEVGKGWLSLDFAERMGFNYNNGWVV